jgi:hypothetical protein
MQDEPEREQLRAISLEAIRTFALAACERSSVREIGEQIGVGRTTLHNFVRGITMPHPRIRRLLALWYVRAAGAVEVDMCDTLLSLLPTDRRSDALNELQAFLREWRRTYGAA